LRLRPHAKTHKSAFVARRQLEHGATGLTAATLTEAEVFAAAGAGDLLIAFPPVGVMRLRRLAALAERVVRLAVSTDSVPPFPSGSRCSGRWTAGTTGWVPRRERRRSPG
jgi:D-serine deaminase-like pyridoxal phosphate-dependent protein